MRTTDFNNTMKRLQKEDGKDYFEKYLQYMGWWFLQLTEKQSDKMADFLLNVFKYPIVEVNGRKWLKTPNGMMLNLD